MIEDCTALILAGGASQRLGVDKTMLEFRGQTLLQAAVAAMQGLFPKVLVSVRQPRTDVDVTQVCDVLPEGGPLAGVCAGLAEARTTWVFAVASDMPFLNPALIRQLAAYRADAEAVVPVVRGFPQPLAAFYARSTLSVFESVLHGPGKRSLRAVLARLSVRFVGEELWQEFGSAAEAFVDIDTPDDLVSARAREYRDFPG